MRRISFDLELEQPNRGTEITDSKVAEERIIQIGWCVFDDEPWEFTVLETGEAYVDIGVPLSTFIKKLTRIKDEDLAAGGTLEEAFLEFRRALFHWKASRIPLQWGGGDLACLRRELGWEPEHPDWGLGRSGMNVKHLYRLHAEMRGWSKRTGGLATSVKRLGLTWLGGGEHDAQVDALNTAQVFHKLYKTFALGVIASAFTHTYKNPSGLVDESRKGEEG